MKCFFFLLIIYVLPHIVIGQQPAYFLFGEKEFEGIDIYNLIQDDEYNYWFATDQGIIKHDGYSYKNVECPEMKSSSVFNFVKDKQGTIYCHNLNHQIFRIVNGKCELFFEIPEIGKGADLYLKTTSQNELIIVSKEVYVLNAKGKSIASTEKIKHNYLGLPYIMNSGLVLFTQSSLSKMTVLEQGEFVEKELSSESKFSTDGSIFQFYKIKDQSYVINITNKQFFKFNETDFSLQKMESPIIQNEHEYVRYYVVDDYLWVASNISGISIFDQNLSNTSFSYKMYEDYFISHVFKDLEGNILLSTFDKGILVIPNLKVLDGLKEFNGLQVTRILSDESDQTYLGTNDGQILKFSKGKKEVLSTLGNKSVEALYKWSGTPFLLTDNSGLTILNTQTKNKKVFDYLAFKSAVQIDANSLYIASNLGVGILRYNESSRDFEYKHLPKLVGRTFSIQSDPTSRILYITTAEGLKIKYPNGKIESLKIDNNLVFASSMATSRHKVYISTKHHGLIVVSKGKVIQQFFPKHKNEAVKIYKFQVKKSRIYANSSIGLIVLDLKGRILHLMNRAAGLATNKIIDFNIKGNSIWISQSRGLQIMDLRKINATIRKPKLVLSKIEVNGKIVGEESEFNFSQNKFSFVLQVPTLKNRENIYYHYKLIPSDSNWISNSYQNNKVSYNSLGPGTYKFMVKAENNGIFSRPIFYSFRILSPFYQRWWFSTVLALVLGGFIALFYRRKLRKQQLKSDQLNELNASKLTAIQSQMNPHFIFNSLNSIQDLVLKGDVTNSYTFITKFSNLVRRTLNYSDKDFIDFDQEVKLLELYLSLEKLRFKESLEFTLETNEIDDIQVPPMLIQPFIENALLHGLLHKEGLKKLKIEFKLEETLICEITDNGIGREKSKEIKERQRSEHESFAIGAIKKRFEILEKHFEGELGFEYIDLKNGERILGTKVILKIPIKRKF